MNRLSRRDLMIAAAGCAVTPLGVRRLSAAELKVDLRQERVGHQPASSRSWERGVWLKTGRRR
jgi:hypothetical protein